MMSPKDRERMNTYFPWAEGQANAVAKLLDLISERVNIYDVLWGIVRSKAFRENQKLFVGLADDEACLKGLYLALQQHLEESEQFYTPPIDSTTLHRQYVGLFAKFN